MIRLNASFAAFVEDSVTLTTPLVSRFVIYFCISLKANELSHRDVFSKMFPFSFLFVLTQVQSRSSTETQLLSTR